MFHYQYQRGHSPSISHFNGNDHRDSSPRILSISSLALRTTASGTKTKTKEDVFPLKLYTLLESVDAMGFTTLPITRLPHGRAFIVEDTHVFVREVMPRFWTATKFRSFTRQLSLWDISGEFVCFIVYSVSVVGRRAVEIVRLAVSHRIVNQTS